jgi:hypothetical protein
MFPVGIVGGRWRAHNADTLSANNEAQAFESLGFFVPGIFSVPTSVPTSSMALGAFQCT